MAKEFIRTTGGLLEGQQRFLKPSDFSAAVKIIEQFSRGAKGAPMPGLEAAKQFFMPSTTRVAPSLPANDDTQSLDLQKNRTKAAW